MSVKTIELAFSQKYGFYGSKEHYCHLLWGYALPGVHEVLKRLPNTTHKYRILLEECGPVMNRLLMDIFGVFKCEVLITNNMSASKIEVPRWDIMLHRSSVLSENKFSQNPFVKEFKDNLYLLETLNQSSFLDTFLESILVVKQWFIDTAKQKNIRNTTQSKYLILKRSAEPSFYSLDGVAEYKGYGVSRRSFIDVDQFADYLTVRGYDIEIYEPGAHSIFHQVESFNNCDGVIGIRGAECANAIWMKKNSQLIVITPENMNTPPIYRRISELIDVDYLDFKGKGARELSLFDSKEQLEVYLNA